MKKATVLCLALTMFLYVRSQEEVGYTTTDIGAQFQWHPSGTITSLHVAFNSRMHHSMLLQLGYNKTDRQDKGEKDNETGSGFGAALGYRYYFRPYPHKFFIGAKADVWRMKIDWLEEAQPGQTKTWTVQPMLEIGYTLIINDQAFVTPFIANGVQVNVKTEGDKVGDGFITLIGLSAGFRL
jgi:hypothetical protein